MSGGVPQQLLPRSIRNCTNQTNIDTIQCESYAPKLRQRPPLTGIIGPQPKSVHTKPNRERSNSRSRCIPSVVSNLSSGRSPNVCNNRIRRENSVNSVIRKEVYTTAESPALVEVTVKTHGQNGAQQGRNQLMKSANAGNRGEPWSKVLQKNNVLGSVASEGSSFSNFDPLRTVHFLAQELQSKLQDNLSDDDHSIRQIISDMQQALNRVPPEVASTLGLTMTMSPNYILQNKRAASPAMNAGFNYDYPTRDNMRQERFLGIVTGGTGANTVEQGCQTTKCKNLVLEPEKFQQHLEFSTAKIEAACRQMEVVCSKLKTDKEELERELLGEREQVLKLRAQLEQTSINQKQVEGEKNSLQRDMQQLRLQLGGGNSSQTQLLQQFQQQKAAAEDQLSSYRQQLTIAKMETEKYVAILAARDKQVTEIRSEMNQLQELVIEQLREIQTAPYTSSVTSCTTNATTSKQSFPWLPTSSTLQQTHNKSTNGNDAAAKQFFDLDRDIYKEIADAMAANKGGGCGGSSTAAWGGDTVTTTYTSAGDSGASSTTTIAAPTTSATFTADKQQNVEMNEAVKAANLMLSTCGGLTNNKQQQQSSVEQQPPHSVSIRDMFAEITKQALLIKAHQQ